MFKDLPDNKAIKMGEVYVVKLAASFYHGFEVNGVRVNGGLQTLPNLDNIFSVNPSVKKLIHYKLGEDAIPVVDYNVKNPSRYYDSDYEEYVFDSLEHEYEVKKEWERIKSAVPVYDETPEQLVPVEIEVVGSMVDTGSMFISTPYQYGKAFFDSRSGLYSLNKYQIACDEVKRVKEEYPNIDIDQPTYSGLEYLKVDGTYIFTRSPQPFIKGSCSSTVFTALGDAQVVEKEVRNFIRSRMMVEIKPVVADSVLLKDVYNFLDNVKTTLSEIEVKQKSYNRKQGLLNRLREKMTELGNIVS